MKNHSGSRGISPIVLLLLSMAAIPRLLIAQARTVSVRIECKGGGAEVCRDAQEFLANDGGLEKEMAKTLADSIRYFAFKTAASADRCGVLQIEIIRESSEAGWHAVLNVFPYRRICPTTPTGERLDPVKLGTLSATDREFGHHLAKSLAGILESNKDFSQKLASSLGNAIPLGFDAAFEDVNDANTGLRAKVLIKPPPDIDDRQLFATATYNVRSVDGSIGPFVFRFIGMGCAAQTGGANLIINARSFNVAPDAQAKDANVGRQFSPADFSNVRTMTQNIVYLLMIGTTGECTDSDIPAKGFLPPNKEVSSAAPIR